VINHPFGLMNQPVPVSRNGAGDTCCLPPGQARHGDFGDDFRDDERDGGLWSGA